MRGAVSTVQGCLIAAASARAAWELWHNPDVVCPICQKRKAKRFCPAKGEMICSVCCGTEREVTIDCPSECPFLASSRQYDWERREREFDWSVLPFPEVKVPPSFARDHDTLLAAISYAIVKYARDTRPLVDADALAALQALAEAYRTLTSGLYYEKPPDYIYQRQLYDALKAAIEEYKKTEAQRLAAMSTHDSDIRDALIFFTQLGARYTNGRPKSRAYLDFLRSQLHAEDASKAETRIVLP